MPALPISKRYTLYRLLPILAVVLGASSCGDKEYSPEKAAYAAGKDLIIIGIEEYRFQTSGYFFNKNLQALEAAANQARESKERFKDGTWKLAHLYASLACDEAAAEPVWQDHEKILTEWTKQFPESITAHVAKGNFLTQYAWHARGTSYLNEVSPEALLLMNERFKQARTVLDHAKSLPVKCPGLWASLMNLAPGQSWPKPEFAKVFEEAKAIEPQYFEHDLAQARFLMTRWQGDEGDWEAAAEKEILRVDGLGLESYVRVIMDQRGYYDDLFAETKASWSMTQTGFEMMRKKYPESIELLNAYTRLACIAEDRTTALRLFDEIDNRATLSQWGDRKRFNLLERWARQ